MGLTKQALIVDVAAKVLADNIAALMCATAQATHLADTPQRLCNRSYACGLMQRVLPHIVLMIGDMLALIANAVDLLAATTQRRHPGRSRPLPAHPRQASSSLCVQGVSGLKFGGLMSTAASMVVLRYCSTPAAPARCESG